jgi:alpha-galactosidase
VNVPNAGGYVKNLPADGIVEVPAKVDSAGVHPLQVGPLPEPLAALCRQQITIQRLIVEAYRERSRDLLLQALVLDPIVDSVDRAERMLDYMLDLQSDYLPAFD